MLTVLRQRRYLALLALMSVAAAVCVALGTWQIARLDWKHTANDDLRRDATAPVAAVNAVLPVVPQRPDTDAVEYRRVTAAGTYDPARQVLVRRVQLNGNNGYWVLTPLRTPNAVLLVVRGFVTSVETPPAPPPGTVSITGRVQPSDTADDKAAALHGQVESVNAVQQAARLAAPTYTGYVQLLAGQPGTAGLTALPEPDLSNPAGGAIEPQHVAYILQWYLFAMMALAGPLILARAESRRGEDRAEDDLARDAANPAEDDRPHEGSTTQAPEHLDPLAARYGRTGRRVEVGSRRTDL